MRPLPAPLPLNTPEANKSQVDYVASKLAKETARFETSAELFAKPADPPPFPPRAPLAGNFVRSGSCASQEIRASAA